MADMVGREIEQQPDMRVSESVVDAATISPCAHHIGSTEQPQRLADHVLGDPGKTGQITHAQLAGLQQRMQDGQPSGITEQPEQFRSLNVRLAAREAMSQLVQWCGRLVAMRRAAIQIHDGCRSERSHDGDDTCADEQISVF